MLSMVASSSGRSSPSRTDPARLAVRSWARAAKDVPAVNPKASPITALRFIPHPSAPASPTPTAVPNQLERDTGPVRTPDILTHDPVSVHLFARDHGQQDFHG